jgi:hypothetical protein
VWSEEEMAAASRRWRDTILGHEEEVSEENEQACKESVGNICEMVIKRAERGIESVKEAIRAETEERYRNVFSTVMVLWHEEQTVAKAMLVT